MVSWSVLIPAGIVGGLVLAAIIIIFMVKLQKKSNIDYIILQTFEGLQRPSIKSGYVDVKNDGTRMAEHIVGKGPEKINIGTFHQKFLKPSSPGRYIMFLEEHDVGRYRPLEYNGDIKKTKVKIAEFTDEPLLDKNSKNLLDDFGNPLYKIKRDANGKEIYKEEEIDISSLVSVPNDDIDYILSRKEKNKRLLEKKQESNKWLPYLIGGAAFIFVFLGVILSSYYNYQASANVKAGLDNFDAASQTERIINLFVEKMTNATTKDVFTVEPIGENVPKPPGK